MTDTIRSLRIQVQTWDCRDVFDLQAVLTELKTALDEEGLGKKLDDEIDLTALPIAGAYENDVNMHSSYPIWTCDEKGRCLVGDFPFQVETLDEITGA